MANKRNRYLEMEALITKVILVDLALFFLYFIVAALGVVWLKIILGIFVILVSGLGIGFLYLTRELTRKRSLWMTVAFGSMLLCQLFSLILNYPS